MTCEFVGWCALPVEAQAAWVQAVGSVLAIAAAIWLADRERRGRRKDDRNAKLWRLVVVRKTLISTIESLISEAHRIAAQLSLVNLGALDTELVVEALYGAHLTDAGLKAHEAELHHQSEGAIERVIELRRKVDQYITLYNGLYVADSGKVRRFRESRAALVTTLEEIQAVAREAATRVRLDDEHAPKPEPE